MYKEANKAFRTDQRRSEHENVQMFINELCESHLESRCHIQMYFWFLVNRNRKRGVTVQATIDKKYGETLYNPDQIRIVHVYIVRVVIIRHWLIILLKYYVVILLMTSLSYLQFTRLNLCRTLKQNKAAGWDNIVAEHLIYGGNYLYKLLTVILNSISSSHNVPLHFRKATIVPIPKGQHKNIMHKTNYQGITLLSVIGKVYEKYSICITGVV